FSLLTLNLKNLGFNLASEKKRNPQHSLDDSFSRKTLSTHHRHLHHYSPSPLKTHLEKTQPHRRRYSPSPLTVVVIHPHHSPLLGSPPTSPLVTSLRGSPPLYVTTTHSLILFRS
ncbi:hypothetical protein PIB30_113677, partial [Stylosanthes scabra]|nr:hypothetical protein [Stylosanthes scabra]